MARQAGKACQSFWKETALGVAGVLVVVLALVGSVAGPAAAADSFGATLPVGSEIDSLRTLDSKTFVGAGGTFVEHVYQSPVNYKEAGTWQPIDNSLVGDPFTGYENAANRLQIELPADLGSAPVRVSDGSRWVAFSLDGASGLSFLPSGATQTYFTALPGVDVSYTATGDSLEEAAVLSGPSSQRSFSYSVSTSSGLAPAQQPDGSIDFVDTHGRAMFSFSPPLLTDAAGDDHAASYQLSSAATGYTVTLDADSTWLSSPDRVWPVTIDPSLTDDSSFYLPKTPNPTQDGYIQSASTPSGSFGATSEKVGWNSTGGVRRTLQQYSPVIPKGAQILNAKLNAYMQSQSSTPSASVGVYSMTQPWTTSATWNTYDGTNPWPTSNGGQGAGGDYAAEPGQNGSPWAKTTVGGSGSAQWYTWDITQLVGSWQGDPGVVPNLGLMLKDVNETTNADVFTFASGSSSAKPYISITYNLGLGDTSPYSFETFPVGSQGSVKVNYGNGNALLCQTDLSLPGANGFDLNIKQCWNSMGGDPNQSITGNWLLAPGQTTYLDKIGTSVVYHDDTGDTQPFTSKGSGQYISPMMFNATLTAPSGGGNLTVCSNQAYAYLLTLNATSTSEYFNTAGQLIAKADATGDTICFAYTSTTGQLSSITDSEQRTITFTPNSSGHLGSITVSPCASGTCTYTFGYDSAGRLTTVTDPTNAVTRYGYNTSNGNLTSVTDPNNNTTSLGGYTTNAGGQAVGAVTGPGGQGSPITSFGYGDTSDTFCATPATKVTYTNGDPARYCFDTGLTVSAVKGVAPTIPTPAITGPVQVGQTATATSSINLGAPISTNLHYQWQVSTDASPGSWQPASGTGANAASYTAASDDYNKYLQVVITADNIGANGCSIGCGPASRTSNPTAAVLPAAPTGGGVSVSGSSLVGGIVTASACSDQGWSPSNPSPSCAYQWQVSSDGVSGWTNASGGGATAASYTVTSSDSTKYLRVAVTATNAGGMSTVASSPITEKPVANLPDSVQLSGPVLATGAVSGATSGWVVAYALPNQATVAANADAGTFIPFTPVAQAQLGNGGTYTLRVSSLSALGVDGSGDGFVNFRIRTMKVPGQLPAELAFSRDVDSTSAPTDSAPNLAFVSGQSNPPAAGPTGAQGTIDSNDPSSAVGPTGAVSTHDAVNSSSSNPIVHSNGVIGTDVPTPAYPCSNNNPYGEPGLQLVQRLPNRYEKIGETFTSYATAQFVYLAGAKTTTSVGFSYSGAAGDFHVDGYHTTSFEGGFQYKPKKPSPLPSHLIYVKQVKVGYFAEWSCQIDAEYITNYETFPYKDTGGYGTRYATLPKANQCSAEGAGTWLHQTGNVDGKLRKFTIGIDLEGLLGIALSSETDASEKMNLSYYFPHSGHYMCGNDDTPGTATRVQSSVS